MARGPTDGVSGMVGGEQPVPLAAARQADLPRLRRECEAFAGESPARFQRRIRLERHAALLAADERRIIDIAIGSRFGSHEAFTRAFRSHFGSTPSEYRRRAAGPHPDALRRVSSTGPCIGLYQISPNPSCKDPSATTTRPSSLEPAPPSDE